MVLSHLRVALGVCVLAAGLLMGGAGGAVAVADPDSSGSPAHSEAPPTLRPQPQTGKQPGGQHQRARLARAREPGQQPGEPEQPGRTKHHERHAGRDQASSLPPDGIRPGGTDTRTRRKTRAPSPRLLMRRRFPMRRPPLGWRRPPLGSRRPPLRRRLPMGRRRPPLGRRSTGMVAPAPKGPRRLPLWSRRPPMGSAPVSDIIASIQDMLTPVACAVVPLTQLQSDLYSFLLGSDVSR